MGEVMDWSTRRTSAASAEGPAMSSEITNRPCPWSGEVANDEE